MIIIIFLRQNQSLVVPLYRFLLIPGKKRILLTFITFISNMFSYKFQYVPNRSSMYSDNFITNFITYTNNVFITYTNIYKIDFI